MEQTKTGSTDPNRGSETMTSEPTDEMLEAVADAIEEADRTDHTNSLQGYRRRRALMAITAMRSSLPNPEGMTEALRDAREAIASLDEFALGGVDIPDTHTGESVGQYGVRDELLAKIDAALASTRVEPDLSDEALEKVVAHARRLDAEEAASDEDVELVEIIEKRLTANVVSLAAACEMGRGAAASKTVAKRIAASIAERISSRDDGLREHLRFEFGSLESAVLSGAISLGPEARESHERARAALSPNPDRQSDRRRG